VSTALLTAATLWTADQARAQAPTAPASAQAAQAPAAGGPATAGTDAATAATATAATTTDPLKEAIDLVEVQADTRANLERAIGLYRANLGNASIPLKVRVAGYNDLSRAYLRLGDNEKSDDKKIAAYNKGREAAQAALALDNRSADAWFWDMANYASVGRTKGVMNSLFMLPELRKGLKRALDLEPGHRFATNTLGEIDHAVPGLVGGSDSRAEQAYLDTLKRDPRFTPTMVLLAKLYRDQGDKEKARLWAQKTIDTKNSSIPHDWRKFDKPEAQKILNELKD
jgi:hypothetical protein